MVGLAGEVEASHPRVHALITCAGSSAAMDPAIAQRAAAAQAAMYHVEPADAAARIVEATVRRRPRTMIGRESRLVDVLVRLAPTRYWAAMRRPLRDAIDTTTRVR